MKPFVLSFLATCITAFSLHASDHVVYEPAGEAKGKHIVLLSGDEEYRSEEGMPMLGKILSQRHGFKCTVLFSLGADGTIDPTAGGSLSHPEALDSADAIVMLLRFRHWDDATSKRFEAAINRGVPIIALRTSTHAFNGYPKDSPYAAWNFNNNGGWGRKFLGETWVSHWGKHKVEATKGIIEAAYGLVSGGSVWVVNVDSNESLATWLRRYKFIYVHDVEVTPITDLHDLLDGYINHRS